MPKVMGLAKIASRYADMMNSGQLLSNRATIDVIDQRIMQLAERIDVDDAPDRMKTLYGLWEELNLAIKEKNATQIVVLSHGMDMEFQKAYHDYAAWGQMMEVFDLRRKMVDSEVKIIKELKAILTAEQAHTLVAKLMAVCIRLIKDPKTLQRINYEFSRIIGEHDLHEPADIVDVEEEDEEAE